MGLFARVKVDNSIELPHFPEEIDRTDMTWQSKSGLSVHKGPYRITGDGRLEQNKTSYREKTEEEKQSEAEQWGCSSWEEYVQAYEENDDSMVPDFEPPSNSEREYPPVYPSENTIDEQWWADISHHGTFEFHQVIKRDPALDVYLEYEARFTEGDLDEIVFMGSRMGYADDPVEYALEQIEEWREWKEEKE